MIVIAQTVLLAASYYCMWKLKRSRFYARACWLSGLLTGSTAIAWFVTFG